MKLVRAAIVITALAMTACSSRPSADGLRNSFAQQLQTNKFIADFQRSAPDTLRFTGPGANGEDKANWRVQITSAVVEDNSDSAKPYKGTVKSSWYSNDQLVNPRGSDSNLPVPLTAGGLAQECWALWNTTEGTWEWE